MPPGLDDVIAADTILSDVDGTAGRLVIRGRTLESLAGQCRYEDALILLWDGLSPKVPGDLASALGAARSDVFRMVGPLLTTAARLPAIDAVRLLMSALPDEDSVEASLRLVAAPAVLLPAMIRLGRGTAAIPPRPELHHAADMLTMLSGDEPDAVYAAALDSYLVTVIDHGLNASTFAARVVASTQAGLTSVVLAALGALKGPLHGGAPGPVLDMLDAIGTAENAASWIEGELRAGRRLMGFGHRIYRVRDPRADALSAALATLGERSAACPRRLQLAFRVEKEALAALVRHKPERALKTNVEFYTALLLEALGFPREAFTAVFAAGRVGGWIAHAREQVATGRLLRPQSRYVGPSPKAAA